MLILVADDQAVPRRVLEETLAGWGYEVRAVADGDAALAGLLAPDAPRLAILDWEMPGANGVEVCRLLRQRPTDQPPYLILLTVRDSPDDVVAGLRAGADDYLTKPFRDAELAARLSVAQRTLDLQQKLAQRVRELEQALAQVKQLRGMLPMCAWCKKVRDDRNYWQGVEDYLRQHTDADFTHGICPECYAKLVTGHQ
jgi:phosphoserine phosphatase RsbU/P